MSYINSTTITLCFAIILAQFSHSTKTDSDSSENSMISFVKMEATISSKIVHFKWLVDVEKKGNYFIIEKSLDGHRWRKISQVKSIENHSKRHTYLTSEINLIEGAHEYFRIKRVDQNGNTTILDDIIISQPILNYLFIIPITGKNNREMIASCNSLICSEGEIIIYNESGVKIYRKNIHLRKGYNRFILNIRKFEKGTFTVIVKNEFGNTLSKTLSKGQKVAHTKF